MRKNEIKHARIKKQLNFDLKVPNHFASRGPQGNTSSISSNYENKVQNEILDLSVTGVKSASKIPTEEVLQRPILGEIGNKMSDENPGIYITIFEKLFQLISFSFIMFYYSYCGEK